MRWAQTTTTLLRSLLVRLPGRSPRLTVNESRFDRLQIFVLEQIIRSTIQVLREAGLPEVKIRDTVGEIAGGVSAIFDGCPDYVVDGQRVVTLVAFASTEECKDPIWAGGTSWMHEYVWGTLDEILEEEADK